VARRKIQRLRRAGVVVGREPIGGKCEAAECPHDAVAAVFIPDSGRDHRLCEQHALAIEMQLRRNRQHAKAMKRQETEERLGLR
jgi:hypothetical protein